MTKAMPESVQGPSSSLPERNAEKLTLGPELVQARERLGLTQAHLAAVSRVSLASIKGYETGRTVPGARELKLLCQALEITPNKLLFGVEAPFAARALSDAATFVGPYGVVVHRRRIQALLSYLTADECASFYSLMSALVLARQGSSELNAADQGADLFAGFDIIKEDGPFIEELFRAVTQNKETAKQFAAALKQAAAEASKPEKVSKK